MMKKIESYWLYDIPQDEDLNEAISIANKNDVIVRLEWFYAGRHSVMVRSGMTLEECRDKLPKRYSV